MAKTKPTETYKQMEDQLQSLVDWFESDAANLDEAADKYQQAMELLKQMEDFLKTAENRIKKISLQFGDE